MQVSEQHEANCEVLLRKLGLVDGWCCSTWGGSQHQIFGILARFTAAAIERSQCVR